MGYTCTCPVTEVHYELETERKGNSFFSTAATPKILNHVTSMDKGNKRRMKGSK